jgi:hypothetical protein
MRHSKVTVFGVKLEYLNKKKCLNMILVDSPIEPHRIRSCKLLSFPILNQVTKVETTISVNLNFAADEVECCWTLCTDGIRNKLGQPVS